MSGKDWTAEENQAIVLTYFQMLKKELSGEAFNKREHRRNLLPLLSGRTEASIELKNANISAILEVLGYPSIKGYKPRSNFQRPLIRVVEAEIMRDTALLELAQRHATSLPQPQPTVDILDRLEPRPQRASQAKDKKAPYRPNIPRQIDYAALEARNRELGLAGERFALQYEQARLIHAGKDGLAGRIEHISANIGDGAGFDIKSFEANGTDRLIEVKTTAMRKESPFYITKGEVQFSRRNHERYSLYRVFNFRQDARLFTLPGSIEDSVKLEAQSYLARP